MVKMILGFYLLLIAAVNAQLELTPVSCSGIDDIACNELKKKESARVNLENGKKFIEALKDCRPIKTNQYLIDKLFKTNAIEGKVGDKCKIVFSVVSSPARQVCLFDQVAMALMNKDPKSYTPEEQVQSSTLFNQQCKAEIIGEGKDAEDFRKISKTLEDSQAKLHHQMKEQMIEKMNKDLSDFKVSCNTGDKKACADLDQIKKDLPTECQKPVMKEVCEKLKVP
jgi:hypothetical protein